MSANVATQPPADGPGEGIRDLFARVARLEISVSGLRADVSEIKGELKGALPHLAAKSDVANSESRVIRWFIGTAIGIAGIVAGIGIAIARFIYT